MGSLEAYRSVLEHLAFEEKKFRSFQLRSDAGVKPEIPRHRRPRYAIAASAHYTEEDLAKVTEMSHSEPVPRRSSRSGPTDAEPIILGPKTLIVSDEVEELNPFSRQGKYPNGVSRDSRSSLRAVDYYQPFGPEEPEENFRVLSIRKLGMIRPLLVRDRSLDYGCSNEEAETFIDALLEQEAPLTSLSRSQRMKAYDHFCTVWNTTYVAVSAADSALQASEFGWFSNRKKKLLRRRAFGEDRLNRLFALHGTFESFGFVAAAYQRKLHAGKPAAVGIATLLLVRNDRTVKEKMLLIATHSKYLRVLSARGVPLGLGFITRLGVLASLHSVRNVRPCLSGYEREHLGRPLVFAGSDLALYRVMLGDVVSKDAPKFRVVQDGERVMVVYVFWHDNDFHVGVTDDTACVDMEEEGLFAYQIAPIARVSGAIVVAMSDQSVVGLHNGMRELYPVFRTFDIKFLSIGRIS